jgi:hypothetical protein
MILKTFSLDVKPSKVETFALDGVNGAKLELTIFSKANNRNKAYFDITNLLYDDETAKKLIFNFNHDSNDVIGGVMVNQLSNIRLEQGQNGSEIKATFNSTDVKFLERLESVTGVSIEIMVAPEYIYSFKEGGEFYSQVEWVGMAFLTGVMAGSGDSRVNEIETYSLENNLKNYMSDQQAQAIVDALSVQNQTLNLILQELIKDNQMDSMEVNMSADEEVVEEVKPIEEVVTETPEEVIETKEVSEEFKAQDEQLTRTEEFMAKLKDVETIELVTGRNSEDETAKETTNVKSLYQSIQEKISNIQYI